jgi:hypothetical protein
MKPPPDPETLKKVIEERNASNNVKDRGYYIDGEYGATFYVDKKGLIHKDSPDGKIVDYVGYTEEQIEKMKDSQGVMPMPR